MARNSTCTKQIPSTGWNHSMRSSFCPLGKANRSRRRNARFAHATDYDNSIKAGSSLGQGGLVERLPAA